MTDLLRLPFVKMHGAGNDYIYLDGIGQDIPVERAAQLATRLVDRHTGIGGDGLILLAPSRTADCRMVVWNADGSRGAMCGNGIRCLARLAFELGIVDRGRFRIETDSGVRAVELIEDGAGQVVGARVEMGEVRIETGPEAAEIGGRSIEYHRADVGNPHAVVFLQGDPSDFPVAEIGAAFQNLPAFPNGVNVEFCRARPPGALDQRTFERGSGETLACGSGATAAAVVAVRTGHLRGPAVDVHLRGGRLRIDAGGPQILMEGPAEVAFRGVVEIADDRLS